MTISYVEPVITYVSSGNGTYPFAFKVLAESDIEVWYTSASTGARVQLVRGSDFSVAVSDPGGTVTILDNAPAGGQILIERRVPIDQPTDWVNNGPFDMDLLEADLDRIIMIVQQLGWDVSSGQAAINFRGPWATTTAYTIRDIVRTSNGNYYFCIVNHTSGTFATDLADGNWVLLIDFEAIETHATNAAASATSALASRNTAIARSAAAELSEIAAAASATAAAADADEIRDWPVSTGLATDVAEHLAFSRKNLLINGGFDVWQRGTSFSGDSSKYTADRWYYYTASMPAGTSIDRQPFVFGQSDVPGNPEYYMRITLPSHSGLGVVALEYIAPYVHVFSERTVTLSFWVRTDATKYLACNAYQHFGFLGSSETPAVAVADIFSSGTSWVRKTVTLSLPSVSGKFTGSTNDYTVFYIVLSYNGGTLTGHPTAAEIQNQAGVFDIANVQLEFGDTATDFEYRHPAEELALCQWYYEKATVDTIAVMLSTTQAQLGHMSYAPKRKTPVITWPAASLSTGLPGTPGTIIDASARTHGFAPTINWTGGTAAAVGRMRYVDVEFDAEIY